MPISQSTITSKQVDGNHYCKYSSYPLVDFFNDTNLNFCLANIIKYLARVGVDKDKNGIGISKAIHYLDMYSEFIMSNNFRTSKRKVIRRKYLYYCPNKLEEIFYCQFDKNIIPLIQDILSIAREDSKELMIASLKEKLHKLRG